MRSFLLILGCGILPFGCENTFRGPAVALERTVTSQQVAITAIDNFHVGDEKWVAKGAGGSYCPKRLRFHVSIKNTSASPLAFDASLVTLKKNDEEITAAAIRPVTIPPNEEWGFRLEFEATNYFDRGETLELNVDAGLTPKTNAPPLVYRLKGTPLNPSTR